MSPILVSDAMSRNSQATVALRTPFGEWHACVHALMHRSPAARLTLLSTLHGYPSSVAPASGLYDGPRTSYLSLCWATRAVPYCLLRLSSPGECQVALRLPKAFPVKASMHWPRANRVGVHSTGVSFHDLVRMSSGNIGLRSELAHGTCYGRTPGELGCSSSDTEGSQRARDFQGNLRAAGRRPA